MKRLVYMTGLFALLALQQASAADVEPQIKVTSAELWYANPEYIDKLVYKLNKHNATYNNIRVNCIITQDLPADVVTRIRVYACDSEHKNARLLLEDSTPICKESPNRKLLPKVVVLDKSKLQGKCVKRGVWDIVDMGNFRFEVLVPRIHEISTGSATPRSSSSRPPSTPSGATSTTEYARLVL
ncbi:uncharacterized protein LOC107980898 [Nasonia vitripennis]|uniref:Uncharacterized protein n=1 Tax=Nasonia vitripennis TaxID=7425 RepID=A0A7M7PW03_NASVI|nr:uncharacterized protein LOC107980898 [Nasonia vitripennis]